MAIEKEIRIKADGSGLRQLREEGLAMYRDLIGGSQQLSEQQEKALEKLREQLQVINQKSSLDKLIGDIRSSYTGAKRVQVMPDVSDDVIQDSRQIAVDNIRQLVSDMADSFEEELKRQTDARRQMGGAIPPTPDRTEEKPAPGQPKVIYDDDGNVQSLEWTVEPPVEQKPKRKRKPKTEAIEFDVDGQPVTPPPSTPVDTEGVSAGFPIPLPVQEVNPIQVPDYSDILREIADNGKPRNNARTSTDPVQEQIDFERKLMPRRAAAGLTGDSKKIDSISRTVDDLKDDDITPISSQSQEVTNVSDTGGETIRGERNVRTEVVNETNVERNVNNARETVDNSHTETNNSSTIEHIAESTRNIDRNTENINETVRNVSRVNEDMKAEPVSSPEFNRTDDSNTSFINSYDDSGIISSIEKNGEIITAVGDRMVGMLQSLSEVTSKIRPVIQQGNAKLESIYGAIVSQSQRLDDWRQAELDAIDDLGDRIGDTNVGAGVNVPDGDTGSIGKSVFKGVLGGNIASMVAQFAIDSLKNAWEVFKQRDIRNYEYDMRSTWDNPIQMTAQRMRVEAQNEGDKVRWIPFVGEWLGRRKDVEGEVAADRFLTIMDRVQEMEQNVLAWSQTTQDSITQSIRRGYSEGSYAASSLGMTVDEYMNRRAGLLRASGGVIGTSQTGDIQYGQREAESLMAAERLYGLQSVDQLQGVMRFASTEDNMVHTSSVIIRSFEQAMAKVATPFEQIASTLDEHIQTFTDISRDVLSRTGETDAAAIAAIQGIVRERGFVGEQGDRISKALAGQGISQNDVAQAYLQRAIVETHPEVNTLADVRVIADDLSRQPEVIRRLLSNFQEQLGTGESGYNKMREILPNIFTGLSDTDIKELMDESRQMIPEEQRTGQWYDLNTLFDSIMKRMGELKEAEPGTMQYEREAAQRTVGPVEQLMDNWKNKIGGMATEETLGSIKELLEKLYEAVKPDIGTGQEIANAVEDKVGRYDRNVYDGPATTNPGVWSLSQEQMDAVRAFFGLKSAIDENTKALKRKNMAMTGAAINNVVAAENQ
jgi:hypothetical protein|nr:MAG TPA: hypothetical protein [Herelleviridae sp.]